MHFPITHERLRKVRQTRSWNLKFDPKTIEFVQPLYFNLNHETSNYGHAIYGTGIRRSPAVILFQELPSFFFNNNTFSAYRDNADDSDSDSSDVEVWLWSLVTIDDVLFWYIRYPLPSYCNLWYFNTFFRKSCYLNNYSQTGT